jgi:hypothetical protein
MFRNTDTACRPPPDRVARTSDLVSTIVSASKIVKGPAQGVTTTVAVSGSAVDSQSYNTDCPPDGRTRARSPDRAPLHAARRR